jgi:hypothetical protein
MLMSLSPVAVQAGQTTEHTLKSRYSMSGTFDVLITGSGVTGTVVLAEEKSGDKKDLQEVKIRFTATADAQTGVRDFRIATPRGASTVGQLMVVRSTVTQEKGDNNTAESALKLTLPTAVCGSVDRNEDIDCYAFHAEAGQTFCFHVLAMRLQDRIHDLQNHIDPIISIRDAQGSTIASNDNYFYADPFLNHQFEWGGDYVLEIRDVRYTGNQYWQYCIEITDQPFVTTVFPLAVTRGQTAQLQLVGYQLPKEPMALFQAAGDEPCGVDKRTFTMGNTPTNPVPILVSQQPVFLEQPGDNDTAARAQYVSLPGNVAGRSEREADIDYYSFAAAKGDSFSFEVLARRQASALDSHLRVLDESGKQLALNDDLRMGKRSSSDSLIDNWTAPADGLYLLEVRDLHGRGGPEYTYAIVAERAQPTFHLWLDTDKTQLTPGTSAAVFVRAERKNGFAGDIELEIGALPHAVTSSCGKILANGQDGCIVLEADPDAPLGATNITVTGKGFYENSAKQKQSLNISAKVYQEIYQPGGGRGHWPVNMHTVCVGDRSDIWAVTLSDHEITLKPGEAKKIAVKIERAPNFDKNVTLDVTYNHLNQIYGNSLPTGVTLDLKESKTLLTGTTSEGFIALRAAKDAPPAQHQQATVMANVSINFVVKTTFCSTPLWVTVKE